MKFPILLCFSALLASLSPAATERPNFVVIFTDDQGYQDLGCFGSPDIATPNLDRMAAEGMRFTSFYAQTICGPSRTALMTGSYPLRVAQVENRCETHPIVHSDEITIAEVLGEKGYRSAAFGKWDLATHSQADWIPELLPRGQGFDYFFGTPSSNDRVVHLIRNEGVIEGNADMGTLTKRYTDEALGYIEEHRDEPFFVYLAHTMPHTRLEASEEFRGKSKGGLYGDVIEEIDHHTGRILDRVQELGLDEKTYVIFTSDNGPWLLRKDHGGHADPLRSGKTTCWEGGVRVPCIVRAPGRVPAGTSCDFVTATIDFLPTFASLAGARLPDDRVLDGRDISKIWHGEQDGLDRPFFYYQHFYLRGVRQGDWKVMLKHEEGPKSAVARWKNHVAPEDAKPLTGHRLYNLADDIGETTDLAAQYPEKLAELLELAEWARGDIGDFDRIGENARFFDDGPNRLERGSGRQAGPGRKRGERRRIPKNQKTRPTESNRRPNVIVVMTDDQGYGDLGCHGNPVLETPNLDSLHAESVRFTDFHVSPFCTPTRAALMTGNHAGSTGAFRTSSGRTLMHRDEKTLADLFAGAGYATGMVGKWHLGDNAPHRPQDRGFGDVVWHRCGGIGQASDHWGNDYYDDTYERNGEFEKFEGYCTDVWFREGMRFVEENQERPFFLYLALNAPHGPYRVPEEWARPYAGNRDVPNLEKPVEPDSAGVVFEIDLPAGSTELVTRLFDENGKAGGAYFTEVEAL